MKYYNFVLSIFIFISKCKFFSFGVNVTLMSNDAFVEDKCNC